MYGDEAECYANRNGEYELIGFFGGLAILARNEASKTFVVGIVTGPSEDDIQMIGIIRRGVLVTSGTSYGGRFPTLPNC